MGSLCLLPLTACANFFQCENKPACPATSTGTGSGSSGSSTVDFAFVSSTSTAGVSTLTGYNIASGTLTVVNTVTLPFVPVAMAVNPANTLLYVASVPGASSPGIYAYSIGTDGTLTAAASGAVLISDLVGAMALAPDGNHLYTLQTLGSTMRQFVVNTVNGTLTDGGTIGVQNLSCAPAASTPILPTCSIAVSPSLDFVVASFGSLGDEVFGYTTANGLSGNGAAISAIAPLTSSGDFSGVMDGSDNLYVAQTSSMTAYGITSTGNTDRGTLSYAAGSVPRSAVIDPTFKFVYTADVGAGKITGLATGTATALTVLTGSPYAAPAAVTSLGVDSTGAYLVAAGYDATAGLQLYAIGTNGALAATQSAATTTATQYPVLVAMSH